MSDTPITDAIWRNRRPDSPETAASELDSHARRMERDRARLIACLKVSREYVARTHAVIAAANHNNDSPCKPDLVMIDTILNELDSQ